MSSLGSVREIKVSLDFGQDKFRVGRLAIRDRVIYFEIRPEKSLQGLFTPSESILNPHKTTTERGPPPIIPIL